MGVRWIVNPNEAEIVRLIFRSYADGLGMGAIAARLNAQGVASPRQAKGHRARRDGVGAGWDLSAVRVILSNELYRGRRIWNRSHWSRLPGSRRRRRQLRPPSEWVVVERPDLRIVHELVWHQVAARRARVRAHYEHPSQFGKARTEYGAHLLSGRLVCGECGGSLTIRTGQPSRYGCTRHWRRGPAACSNNVLVRRDLAEQTIVTLLQAELYTREGVARLVDAVNARLREARPTTAAQREGLIQRLTEIRHRLDGLRRFVEEGDTSPKVRGWLGDAEAEERRLEQNLEELDRQERHRPLQVHQSRIERYLLDLRGTLLKAGARARQLLHADVERIVIHPVRTETAKPFARAEVLTTGKGLLARVAFVVAGARIGLWKRPDLDFVFLLWY